MAHTRISPGSDREARTNELLQHQSRPDRPAKHSPGRCRRTIPFRVFADAFATQDEEWAPEPDWADFRPR